VYHTDWNSRCGNSNTPAPQGFVALSPSHWGGRAVWSCDFLSLATPTARAQLAALGPAPADYEMPRRSSQERQAAAEEAAHLSDVAAAKAAALESAARLTDNKEVAVLAETAKTEAARLKQLAVQRAKEKAGSYHEATSVPSVFDINKHGSAPSCVQPGELLVFET
jgi:hypothetical protein